MGYLLRALLFLVLFFSAITWLNAQSPNVNGTLHSVASDYFDNENEEEILYFLKTTNNLAQQVVTPVFSHPSGFYASGFTLTLTHPDPGAGIIYTIDGSEPSPDNLSGVTYTYKNQYPEYPGQDFGELLTNEYKSVVYTEPFAISDRSALPNKLAGISSTWHFDPDYIPQNPIKKATVVRAIAVVDGVSSPIITHTYFVSSTSAFNNKLPIAAISLNEDALFDYENGIYVAGKDFDNWRESNPTVTTNGHRPANYRRKGIETEKKASFQYFVNGKEVLNQNIGLRLHGSFSKSAQNKTFRLYARAEYDDQNKFRYSFFGPNNSSSFKRLLLRNSGNDAGNLWIGNALKHTISPAVYFRDAFIQKMVAHLRFDTQDYIPVVTYVNGEYWGLLNLRERYDHHYFERKYGFQETELELLEGNGSVKTGSNDHYKMMRTFLSSENMSVSTNYNYVKTLMDTDNFIDYQISQIYARNTDWPGNNIDYFRKKTDNYEPEAPYGQDGRWRWLMFDTDHGFGWSGANSFTHNSLQNASKSNSSATLILYHLLKNQNFRNNFINRYADLLNTAFLPERLTGLINEMAGNIADEIPLHRERWNTLPDWEENVELMRRFAENRPEYARMHIREKFNISNEITATLNVADPAHGYVRINTIDIKETTPGVSVNPYPWKGEYFQDIPITATAMPKPGYKFNSWSGASNSVEPSITIEPNSNFTLKANFMPLQPADYELLCFWLFDKRIVNDFPLQTLEPTYNVSNGQASIAFYSSYGEAYPFDDNHPNWRKGSMERKNAPTPVNYCPKAYYDLEYGRFDMKGLQVKGPFLGDGHENTLLINFTTTGYANIILSFAAMFEGATKKLKIDYYDNTSNSWTSNNMVNAITELTEEYLPLHIDFSRVQAANNNPDFQIRIRFDGADLTRDKDNRVTFNNIAIHGTSINPNGSEIYEDEESQLVLVYPNPTVDVLYVHVPQNVIGSGFTIYNHTGKRYLNGKLNDENTMLELHHLPPGIYLLGIMGTTKSVHKIVKL
jgi:hypothetical protein